MAISATEKPLGKVFTSDYQLTIPSFQRAYTWQAENIEQLVNDLQDACADPDTPYFLGSLILVKDGPTQYQVIDGQQRSSPCQSSSPCCANWKTTPTHRQPQRPHFGTRRQNSAASKPSHDSPCENATPTSSACTCRKRFGRPVRSEDNDIASHAQRNIAVNTRRTFDLLAAMDAKDRRRFASYLVNGVTLVIVTTDDLAGAHRIFDVMNMRGVPLTASDVFKAKPSRKYPPPRVTPTPHDGTTSWTRSAMTRTRSKSSSPTCT